MRISLRGAAIKGRRTLSRVGRSRIVRVSAILLLIYTAAGFLLAPYLVERYVPSLAEERLGEQASVGAVRINPFTLTFEASDFSLGGGAKPLLAFKRLFLDFDLWNIHRAWTFAAVDLQGADLGLEIDKQGRLNLLELIERLRKPPKPDEPPPQLVINHLRVAESRVSLTDLSGQTPATAALAPINFEIFDLSTLGEAGRYSLQAKLPAGGSLTWTGSVSLQPVAATGEIALKDFRLETAWRFLRDELNLGEPRGALSVAGKYEFSYAEAKPALTLTGLQAELAGVSLSLHGEKRPLLGLKTVRLSDGRFSLAKREFIVNKTLIADGSLSASIGDGGVLDWQRIAIPRVPAGVPRTAPQSTTTDTVTPNAGENNATTAKPQPWHIRLQGIAVENVALDYLDRTRTPELAVRTASLNGGVDLDVLTGAGPTRVLADGLRIALAGVTLTTPGAPSPFVSAASLSLSEGRIDTHARTVRARLLALEGGDLTLATGANGPEGLLQSFATAGKEEPPTRSDASPWTVQIEKVGLAKVGVKYTDASRTPALGVQVGELNGTFGVGVGGEGPAGTRVTDLQVGLDRVTVSAGANDAAPATLGTLRLSGGRIDTGQRLIHVNALELAGGGVRLATGRNGPAGLLAAMRSPSKRENAPSSSAKAAGASEPWRYRLETLALNKFDVAYEDRSEEPGVRYDVGIASLKGTNVDSASSKPLRVQGALRVGGGTANADLAFKQDFSEAAGRVEVTKLSLDPLKPLLARHATLDLASGHASAAARIRWRRSAEPAVLAQGEIRVDDVLVNNTSNGERFVSWKALAATGVAMTVSPTKLAVKEVRVSNPAGRIIIAKDRTVNVTRVLRSASDAPPPAKKPEAAQVAKAEASRPPAFTYDIGRVRLENGSLDFADLSLVLPFATQIEQLMGSIVGISSDVQSRAQINLRGQVDKYGEARADGSLIPRDPTKFLDIRARFTNVDMPLLSPYSATFAGRKVAAGKLSATLEYKIVDSQLAGENKIALQNFALGERVEAPNAMDLPLDLAIALLKDSDGRISLAVPVRGDLGNPKFEYGTLIRGAIANALGRVVSAPFRAIGGLFGKRDVQEVRSVRFAPGSDRIAPAQREQLDALATALKERPQLKVVVRGPYDPARDAAQLRRVQARLAVSQAAGAKLQPGESPGPVAYEDADTQRALEKLLTERGGSDALRELEQSFTAKTGRAPDRVNPILGFFGRGSKDREFYVAVFDRVAELETLADTAVRTLAENRAQAIVETLLKAGVDRNRVQAGANAQVNATAATGITTELALDVIPGAS